MTPPTYPHEVVMINVGVGGERRRCPRLGAHLDLGRRSERGGVAGDVELLPSL